MKINLNTHFATAFLHQVYRAGIRHIVLSPGSRNTPLVFAAVRFTKFHLHSVLDERSAGFYALGIAKGAESPVMLISTSGTAAAEYYPALIEASMTGVPLLFCTADRPEYLTGTGANQTIFQEGMFGKHIPHPLSYEVMELDQESCDRFLEVTAQVIHTLFAEPAAPAHFNFRFDAPLEPGQKTHDIAGTEAKKLTHARLPVVESKGKVYLNPYQIPELKKVRLLTEKDERGIILVGPHPSEPRIENYLKSLSKATGFPIIADGVSNLRSRHRLILSGYPLITKSKEIGSIRPDVIIQCGQWSTSKSIESFVREHGSRRIVLPFKGKVIDPLGTASGYCDDTDELLRQALKRKISNTLYFNKLSDLSKIYTSIVSQHFRSGDSSKRTGIREHLIGNIVCNSVDKETHILIGNSMVVRDWDDFCTEIPPTSRIFSNRGASGIDGLLATAFGIASGFRRKVLLITGDNSFFYDLNSLLLAERNEFPVIIVVINNGGGRIFEHLPVAAERDFPSKYYLTPQTVLISDIANAFRIPYFKAEHEVGLAKAIEKGVRLKKTTLIEAVVDAPSSIADRKHLTEKIIERISEALVE